MGGDVGDLGRLRHGVHRQVGPVEVEPHQPRNRLPRSGDGGQPPVKVGREPGRNLLCQFDAHGPTVACPQTLNLSVDEVLTTTRSVRKRLDFDKPVPRDVLMECLELALQAPTGSNSQGWQWVFVEDAAKKKAIADVYLANARGYLSGPAPEYPDGDTRGERMGRVRDSATYLAEHMHRAPVLLIPCLKGREDESAVGGVSFWASLFPAVWSFCLALRSRGLGSCWTTLHLLDNGEHKVADVLGIPYDEYSQGGLLPIAYTQGIDFRPAKRLPAESVTHWNGW